MSIGDNIRRQRMKLGYKQAELAKLIHTTPQQISRWESNHVVPGLEWIIKISEALGIDEREIHSAVPLRHNIVHEDRPYAIQRMEAIMQPLSEEKQLELLAKLLQLSKEGLL